MKVFDVQLLTIPRRPPKLPHPWPPKLLHLAGVN
jgi:hypothetical protein